MPEDDDSPLHGKCLAAHLLHLYDRLSPPIARRIDTCPWARVLVRGGIIDPFVRWILKRPPAVTKCDYPLVVAPGHQPGHTYRQPDDARSLSGEVKVPST
jgi:hypothetical protein